MKTGVGPRREKRKFRLCGTLGQRQLRRNEGRSRRDCQATQVQIRILMLVERMRLLYGGGEKLTGSNLWFA